MEDFLPLIFIIIFFFGGAIIRSVVRGSKAAYDTATGEGSFVDHLSNKLIVKVERFKDEGREVYGVYLKGAPKVGYSRDISVFVKLFDTETEMPIFATFEQNSEPGTRVYESFVNIGTFQEGSYWPDWVRITGFVDAMITGPHRGRRKLEARVFVWESTNLPTFKMGVPSTSTGAIEYIKHEFEYTFKSPGYNELDKTRLRTQELSVQLATGIAMADGSLDDREGYAIKKWIKEIVDSSMEIHKKETKDALNKALETGFENARAKRIDINAICKEVKEESYTTDKYDLLELCLDVMAADGVADKEELEDVRKISKKIDVDYDEVTKLEEQRLVNLELPKPEEADIDKILGIDPHWGNEKKKKFIRSEFSNWNGKLSSLKDKKQKENAQKMLQLLAQAKKKYG